MSASLNARKDSILKFRFAAKEVYFVTANEVVNQKIEVLLNGKPISQTSSAGADIKDSTVTVNAAQLYRLVKFDQLQPDNTIELRVPAGVQLNVFTFGS